MAAGPKADPRRLLDVKILDPSVRAAPNENKFNSIRLAVNKSKYGHLFQINFAHDLIAYDFAHLHTLDGALPLHVLAAN